MTSRVGYFKSVGFVDLLCDASFAYFNSTLSEARSDEFDANRHARSSILSSALCVECFADCLGSVLLPPDVYTKLERSSTLKKISKCLESAGRDLLDPARAEYQAVVELIELRNSFVHIKTSRITSDVEPDDPHPSGAPQWSVTLRAENYSVLGIPKLPFGWSADNALESLRATFGFLQYVIASFDPFSARRIRRGLVSRFEAGGASIAFFPEHHKLQLERMRDAGIDLLTLVSTEGFSVQ